MVPGTGLTPTALVEQLHAADRQAAVSEVLPKDFLRVNGLQYLLRNQLLQNGQCQVRLLLVCYDQHAVGLGAVT